MEKEETLLKIVFKVNEQIELYDKQQKEMGNVIFLVGSTGTGKSTLFNFLIGAKFKKKEGERRFTLDLESQEEHFSEMNGGMQSITKVPISYYETSQKHLIVDFPGFEDTKDWQDRLTSECLFNKLSQKSQSKIVLVNYLSEEELPNRGTHIQEFFKTVIVDDSVKMEQITLLMNKYNGDTPEEELVEELRTKLQESLNQRIGRIIIQRGIKRQSQLSLFSEESRLKLWEQLIKTPAIQLKPYYFKNKDYINSYLIECSNSLLLQHFQELQTEISSGVVKEIQLESVLIQLFNAILRYIENATPLNLLNWIDNYMDILEYIKTIINSQRNQAKNKQKFKLIYNFFLDFHQEIDGYNKIQNVINQIREICKTSISYLSLSQKFFNQIKTLKQESRDTKVKLTDLEKQLQNATRPMNFDFGFTNSFQKIGQVSYGLAETVIGAIGTVIYGPISIVTDNQTTKEITLDSVQICRGGIEHIEEGLGFQKKNDF